MECSKLIESKLTCWMKVLVNLLVVMSFGVCVCLFFCTEVGYYINWYFFTLVYKQVADGRFVSLFLFSAGNHPDDHHRGGPGPSVKTILCFWWEHLNIQYMYLFTHSLSVVQNSCNMAKWGSVFIWFRINFPDSF